MAKKNKVRVLVICFVFVLLCQNSDGVIKAGYVGCYKDSAENRLLPERLKDSKPEKMTMTRCIPLCKEKGFYFAGLEDSDECFCGNTKPPPDLKVGIHECIAFCGHNFCGGTWRLSVFEVQSDPLYIGCYNDEDLNNRLFKGLHTSFHSELTQDKCNEHCLVAGYAYAGTQSSVECYCSNTKPADDKTALDTECNMKCVGDKSKTCGGSGRMSVFLAGNPLDAPPPTSESSYLGCYRDDTKNRLMKGLQSDFTYDLTPDKCMKLCRVLGFGYAGTQNSIECFCSKTKPSDDKKADESDCGMKCVGDQSKTCGGSNRLSVYSTGVPRPVGIGDEDIISRYLGCYSDSLFRTLTGELVSFNQELTVEFCLRYCEQKGFEYTGLESRQWCFCGIREPSRKQLANEEECAMGCAANDNQRCGGEWRISMYKTKISDDRLVLKYLGCFKESKTRLLANYQQTFSKSLTTQKCVRLCKDRGYQYAGTENGKECFCGNQRPSFKEYTNEEECSRKCDGNNLQTCGGRWRIQIYETGLSVSENAVEDGKYIGCYVDYVNRRSLSGHHEDFGLFLTPLKCSGLCYSKGFLYSGTQSGYECFCGDEYPSSNLRAKEGDCGSLCSGDLTKKCGGELRNSIRETGIPDFPTVGKYLGCFQDQNSKILKGIKIETFEKTNSPRRCMNFCSQLDFLYSGVESGYECFCGNEEPTADLLVNDEDCNMPCSGDSRETCGGIGRLAIYATNATSKVLPLTILHTCVPSETTVEGKESCRNKVVFEERFDSPLSNRWSHVVMVPDAPDFEFAVFNSDPINCFTRNNRLVIKPTVYDDTYVQTESLQLKGCTGTPGSRQCGYQAASFNILPPVATARIHTRNSFSFRYGIVEIRAKLPLGDWLVPELWLEPVSHYYGPSYESGRIRIAMTRGNANLQCDGEDFGYNRLESGVVMGPPNKVQRRSQVTRLPSNWHSQFHNYTLIWTPDNISFKIDNEQTQELVPKGQRLCEAIRFKHEECSAWNSGSKISPFDQDFYISLGLSVGNAWDFPNGCINRGKPKPWRNLEVKAMLKFWLDKANWQPTWTGDKSALQVEHVRVTAL